MQAVAKASAPNEPIQIQIEHENHFNWWLNIANGIKEIDPYHILMLGKSLPLAVSNTSNERNRVSRKSESGREPQNFQESSKKKKKTIQYSTVKSRFQNCNECEMNCVSLSPSVCVLGKEREHDDWIAHSNDELCALRKKSSILGRHITSHSFHFIFDVVQIHELHENMDMLCTAKNVFKYPAITAHSGRKPRRGICTARCENMNRQNSNLKKSTQKWMSARSERKKPRIIERKSDAKTWMPSHFQLALESGCAHKHSFQGFCSYLSQCAAAASADDACIPLYYNKHFAEERKKIKWYRRWSTTRTTRKVERSMKNETKRNEGRREKKSKSVWRVENLTMNKRNCNECTLVHAEDTTDNAVCACVCESTI